MATKHAVEQGLLHQIYPSLYGDAFDQADMDRRFIRLVEDQAHILKNDESLFQ